MSSMDDDGFEGSLVLEQLAARGLVDAFYDAVDADDFAAARALMNAAGVEAASVEIVLAKMAAADGDH